jgi:carboxyl-terminal processing protease
VHYEKGKPVEIADSLRGQFKTTGGRIVLDGGGVKPDVLLDKSNDFGLLKELKDKLLIFDYVTQYVLKNEKAPELETFKFGDFEEFVSFLDSKKFRYDSESEKLLKKLKDNAEKEKYLNTIQGE